MTFKTNTIPPKTLANTITASDTSFQLTDILGFDGDPLTPSIIGDTVYGSFQNATGTKMEIFEIDTSTIDSTNIVMLKRGIQFNEDGTIAEVTDNKQLWVKNETIVNLGTDVPQLLFWFKNYIDGIAIAGSPTATTLIKGIGKVSVAPVSSTNPIFVGDNDPRVPTQAENDALAGTGTPSSSNKYVTEDYVGLSSPPGAITPYTGRTAPTGWLLCDGSAVSRTTYSRLFAIIAPSQTFTVTIASPGVFTATSHGLVAGDKLHFTTTGGLPSGLSTNTDYYVISSGLTTNAFQVSATRGGSAINTTGSQSGVHTLYISNYGKGNGSTTFNIPDMRGYTPFGYKSGDANFDVLNVPNTYVGEKTHTLITSEIPSHTHPIPQGSGGGATGWSNTSLGSGLTGGNTLSTGGDGAHNNMPPYVIVNWIIKI